MAKKSLFNRGGGLNGTQRITGAIIFTVIAGVGGTLVYNAVTSGNEFTAQETAGKAKLNFNPNDKAVNKGQFEGVAAVNDKQVQNDVNALLKDNPKALALANQEKKSDINNKFDKLHEQSIEEKSKLDSGKSHIDALQAANKHAIAEKVEEEDSAIAYKGHLRKMVDRRRESLAEEERKKEAENNRPRAVAQNPNQHQINRGPAKPTFDAAAFLEKELARAAYNTESMDKITDSIVSEDFSSPKAIVSWHIQEQQAGMEGGDPMLGEPMGGPNNPYYQNGGGAGMGQNDYGMDADSMDSYQQEESGINGPTQRIVAGEHYYAYLHTGVNTDEPSPIWATVVQNGPLDGAKLLGSFERSGEKALLTFTTLALDEREYSVEAVAIDLNTKKTLLADNVDRHLLERYGMLALASFAGGYADALAESGQSTTDGGVVETTGRIPDASEQMLYAIGSIGKVLTPKLEQRFDTPPTVEVYDSGTKQQGIGILFMSGFDIPKN
ncbi:DotG/IcmE/VirB10 family protein [Neptuniibacter sp. QD37_11]|uniref:DotG/IcmE/VirB10 family protein n=1 Tax=Neptuniibacter sp. QD37_11 TaxID=3398209 RepID=UPI0039F5A15D